MNKNIFGMSKDQWGDYKSSIVDAIIEGLSQPSNRDLLFAVVQHGLTDNGSFMFTFNSHEPMDFDQWLFVHQQLEAMMSAIAEAVGKAREADYRTYEEQYEEYLANNNKDSRLDMSQSQRFEAIIATLDNGWSGSFYGHIMRKTQMALQELLPPPSKTIFLPPVSE